MIWKKYPEYKPFGITWLARIPNYWERERLDTLIEKIRKYIGLLREYRTALLSAAVTGRIDVRNLPTSLNESACHRATHS